MDADLSSLLQTGYRTRSILCMPLLTREGNVLGVTQMLNKREGVFTEYDEKRLGLLSVLSRVVLIQHKPVGTGYIMGVEFVDMKMVERKRLLTYIH